MLTLAKLTSHILILADVLVFAGDLFLQHRAVFDKISVVLLEFD